MVKDCMTCKNYEPKKTKIECPMCHEIATDEIATDEKITVKIRTDIIQLYRCPNTSCGLYIFGVLK